MSLSVGYIVIFVIVSSIATVAVGFSGYMAIFIPYVPEIIIAPILIVLLTIVNFYGISESININVLFTFVELVGLFFIIIAEHSHPDRSTTRIISRFQIIIRHQACIRV